MAEYVDIISMNLGDPGLRPNDGGFQSVDPGTYDFEIEKQATGTSNSGNNTLKVTARVFGPEGSPMIGRTMVNTYVIADTDFARGRMLQLVQASNVPLDANGGFSREALVGLQFTADVEKRAGTTIDKMGNEVTKDFTSWVRERPVGSETAAAPVATQPAPSKPTNGANGNAPRRPQTPNGNGAQATRR